MPTPYAEVQIAGFDLEITGGDKCKCLVLDGANFLDTTAGSNEFAADGTVWTQVMDVAGGRAFGIKAEFIPPDLLNSIVTAIMAAVAGGDSFNVTATDDLHTINAECVPDFGSNWLTYPEQRTHTDVIKSVVFRFVTVS